MAVNFFPASCVIAGCTNVPSYQGPVMISGRAGDRDYHKNEKGGSPPPFNDYPNFVVPPP